MNNEKFYIGSHVSMSGPDYYLGSVKEALSYGSTTFMFYTGAPQNSFRLPTSKLRIEEGRALLKQNGIDESKIIVHAPYIINIANQLNESLYEISKVNLLREIERVGDFGLTMLVLHPGSHVSTGVDNGVSSIINALNEVFEKNNNGVKIALETMAGKGSEMGTSFEQLAYIINNVKHSERVGVCLDTCHISDNGMDVKNFDQIINEFDRVIGLDRLLCIHLNDSKNPSGSHKDRHENLGYGEIGFDTLNYVAHHPKLTNIPKVLETPYVNNEPPYKIEIEMLKNQKFIDWRK